MNGWWMEILRANPDLLGHCIVAGATIVAALVGGLAVWFVNAKIDERKESLEREQQVLKGLKYLTGGTQNRSAGLGLLQGLLIDYRNEIKDPNSKLRAIFLPVVRNQLIYLATTQEAKKEIHEHDNFSRLCRVWYEMSPTEDEKEPLRRALRVRRARGRGLELLGDYKTDYVQLRASLQS